MILAPVEYNSDVSCGIAIHKKFLIPSLQLGIFMLYLIHTIAVGIPGFFICAIRETLINSARADAEEKRVLTTALFCRNTLCISRKSD